MKFNYPDLTSETVDGMRIYTTPQGNYYPSITTVLGTTAPEEKKQAIKRWQDSLGSSAVSKMKAITDTGTQVHLMCERYLKGEDLRQGDEKIDDATQKLFNGLKLKLNKIKDVWGQEVALYSDMLGIAGRCDCIAVYRDQPSIIDYKTSTKIKQADQIEDYYLQMCAYAIMHNELYGTDISQGVILMTSAGGFPQEFVVDLREYVGKLADRVDAFFATLV